MGDFDSAPRAMRRMPAGAALAVGSAVLFGASTPLAKLLVGTVPPLMLAGLLYVGSGLGLSLLRLARRRGAAAEEPLGRRDAPWLAGAILFGGVLGPALLMIGLRATPASSASLLLNLEGVFTALLAWIAFGENVDTRVATGMAAIVAGGLLLSRHADRGLALPIGSLAVAGACLCWGIDNNLTQKVSGGDPAQVAAMKGASAGSVNLALALGSGAHMPALRLVAAAVAVGFVGYGLSLVLYVRALRELGTARTGAYFSFAPFAGSLLSLVMLREPVGAAFVPALALMALGAWLHLTERHEHRHHHERIVHSHRHVHDAHHRHAHPPGTDPHEPHTHEHVHEPTVHSHAHYPDLHHRHRHGG